MILKGLSTHKTSITIEHKYLNRYLKTYVNTSSGIHSCYSNVNNYVCVYHLLELYHVPACYMLGINLPKHYYF